MITILVGSQNPVKINAAKTALEQIYASTDIEVTGINAPSGVNDQPMSEVETKNGAINRVNFCKEKNQADFYIAMEGGVEKFTTGVATFAYIAISNGETLSIGRSANLPLPNKVYQALCLGRELGEVMDSLFNTNNIKQAGGAISLLTKGHATRQSIYTQAIILAMAPFINASLFQE